MSVDWRAVFELTARIAAMFTSCEKQRAPEKKVAGTGNRQGTTPTSPQSSGSPGLCAHPPEEDVEREREISKQEAWLRMQG